MIASISPIVKSFLLFWNLLFVYIACPNQWFSSIFIPVSLKIPQAPTPHYSFPTYKIPCCYETKSDTRLILSVSEIVSFHLSCGLSMGLRSLEGNGEAERRETQGHGDETCCGYGDWYVPLPDLYLTSGWIWKGFTFPSSNSSSWAPGLTSPAHSQHGRAAATHSGWRSWWKAAAVPGAQPGCSLPLPSKAEALGVLPWEEGGGAHFSEHSAECEWVLGDYWDWGIWEVRWNQKKVKQYKRRRWFFKLGQFQKLCREECWKETLTSQNWNLFPRGWKRLAIYS